MGAISCAKRRKLARHILKRVVEKSQTNDTKESRTSSERWMDVLRIEATGSSGRETPNHLTTPILSNFRQKIWGAQNTRKKTKEEVV